MVHLHGGLGLSDTTLAVLWTQCAVATGLMLARFYTNAFVVRHFKYDFWWVLSAYVTGLIANVFDTLSIHWGLGRHIKDLEPFEISKNQFYNWIALSFNVASINLGKLAIIAFILQIQRSASKDKGKWFLYFMGASNTIICIVLLAIIWTQCIPVQKIWNITIEGTCKGRKTNEYFGYFQGSYGAAMDLALSIYPMVVFWSLQLKLHVKIGLCTLFGFGLIASACAAVKTQKLSLVTKTEDITYQIADLTIWAGTEMWVIIIVSCIPPVRPLFMVVFDKVATTASRTSPAKQGYSAQDDSKGYVLTSLPTHRQTNNFSRPAQAGHGPTASFDDGTSLKHILPEVGDEEILKTTKISVNYDGSEGSREKMEDGGYGYRENPGPYHPEDRV